MAYPNSRLLLSPRITADIQATVLSIELRKNGSNTKELRPDELPDSQPVECAKVEFDSSVKLPTFFEIL